MDEVLTIEPGRRELNYRHNLWRYRELFWVLAWRDLSVRYKQRRYWRVMGADPPLLTMLILTIIFGRMQVPSDGSAPYALMVFAGILPWTVFATGLAEASNSLVTNANLISKVYFPQLIVPTATVVVAFVDFLVSFFILLALMIWYQFAPGWQILLLPLFVILTFLASIGPSLWLTALNVRYRDFRYVIPFIVQFGLYASPVGFSSSVVPNSGAKYTRLTRLWGSSTGFGGVYWAAKANFSAQFGH